MTKDELDTAIAFYADHVGKGGMSFINDATVVSTVALLQELKKLRHPEPREERPPMFNELAQRADGGLETRQTEKCPTCGGGYFKAELGWQHNCLWP